MRKILLAACILPLPAQAQDYSTHAGCLTELAEAIRRADGYRDLAPWFQKKLETAPGSSDAKRLISESHAEIAAAMQRIAEGHLILCSEYKP